MVESKQRGGAVRQQDAANDGGEEKRQNVLDHLLNTRYNGSGRLGGRPHADACNVVQQIQPQLDGTQVQHRSGAAQLGRRPPCQLLVLEQGQHEAPEQAVR